MVSPRTLESLGRRARNAAEKRVGLLEAVLDRLALRPLAEIPVKELADEVGIVEQTFFNTFSDKSGLLVFFVMLWSIEMQWRMARTGSAEEALRVLFYESALYMRRARWLMPEIIRYQVSARPLPDASRPTLADKLQRFPNMPGVAELEPQPVQALVLHALERAVADGELPMETDVVLLSRMLCGLFFGAPASTPDPDAVADLLRRGFDTLWQSAETRETTHA